MKVCLKLELVVSSQHVCQDRRAAIIAAGRGDSRIIRFLTDLAREFDTFDHRLGLEPVGDVAGLAVQLPLDHLRRGCRERGGVSISHQRQDGAQPWQRKIRRL